MAQKLAPWLLYCRRCLLWISSAGIPERIPQRLSPIIEENRRAGLKSLRWRNFQKLLDALEIYMPVKGASVCDVGCAYGWFLEAATNRGMKATGIEPDRSVALEGIMRGLDIRTGYFPECIGNSDKFDAITFNDSLEHLPDMDKVFEACYNCLKPSGKLAINIPNSQGFFFRVGCLLYRLGYKQPLHRLWQKDYPSPHLIYFNPQNLERYVSRHGFKLLHTQRLETVSLAGLWERLTMDGNSSAFTAAVIYGLTAASYPFLSWLPSDILLQIYEKC